MSDDALAAVLAAMSADIDRELADMRRRDAIRDTARCTTVEGVASVYHRFELSQALEVDTPAVAVTEGRLQ
jgi:hypothetical protein